MTSEESSHASHTSSHFFVLTLEFFAMEFFVSSSSPFHTSFEFSGVFSFESFTMNSSEMTTEPFEHVSSAFSEFLVLTLEFLAMEFFVSSLSHLLHLLYLLILWCLLNLLHLNAPK
jgi:hypothetical protein